MKICIKCKKQKDESYFYKAGVGKYYRKYLSSWCKKCCDEYKKKMNYFKTDKTREIDRKYQKERRAFLKGYKTEESRIYRKKNPEKVGAHMILNQAVLKRKITRSPCVECGSTYRIHGHHPDYSKPLEVIWVCTLHHKPFHKK